MIQPKLFEISCDVRDLYLRLQDNAIGHERTQGSCFYASFLLASTLQKFGNCTDVFVRGGDGVNDGGYQALDGKSFGHYWVEAIHAGVAYIFDITADQFGSLPVTILQKEDAHWYKHGDQEVVNHHLKLEFPELFT